MSQKGSQHLSNEKNKSLLFLSIAALGVVYGDIGTSPLYTVNEIFFGHGNNSVTTTSIFGAISLIFWSLTLLVTIKYVFFVLRAEYDGEGGVFALFGLLRGMSAKGIAIITTVLVLGAGLLFGDGMITPAISVLSAVEGLSVITPDFQQYVVIITVIILTCLFAIQYKGTLSIGRVFGAVMSVWFAALALMGLVAITHDPAILNALNPLYGLHFIASIGIFKTMLTLGAVVLAVTGGEALYADLGHFGMIPIRMSWLAYVYPALVLNYLGQGAYLLSGNTVLQNNIFYSMVPHMLLIPMVVLATIATIIASQALISGAFSLTAQAIAQGVSPNFKIVHTSHHHVGQIYVPVMNWFLYVGCIALVISFRSSSNLATAYGLAVTGVMLTTSIAMLAISIHKWRWSWFKSILIFGSFIIIDAAFLISNSLKFLQGGYVPFTVGIVLFTFMMVWKWGRELVSRAFREFTKTRDISWLASIKQKLEQNDGVLTDSMGRMVEVSRAVVFLVARPTTVVEDPVSIAARFYIKRKGGIPKCVILLHIAIQKDAYLEGTGYEVINFGTNLYAVNARFGFMEDPNVRQLLKELHEKNLLPYDISQCTIQVAEAGLIIGTHLGLWRYIRARCFKLLADIATPTYRYFGLDADANVSTSIIPIRLEKDGAHVVQLIDSDLTI